jgi:hypothetical protein
MAKARERETLEQRIDFLIGFSRGTMPIVLLAADEAEAARAVAIIAKKRRGKILQVAVQTKGGRS